MTSHMPDRTSSSMYVFGEGESEASPLLQSQQRHHSPHTFADGIGQYINAPSLLNINTVLIQPMKAKAVGMASTLANSSLSPGILPAMFRVP